MAQLVLLILVGLWAAALVPPALRARAEGHPGDTVGAFDRRLQVLRSTGGYAPRFAGGARRLPGPLVLSRRSEAIRRRRDLLVGLLAAMGGTLVLGLLPPLRPLLMLHLVLDVAFAAYIGLLIRARNLARQRAEKVRRLPSAVPEDVSPTYELDLRELVSR